MKAWMLAKVNIFPDIFHEFKPSGNLIKWIFTITNIQVKTLLQKCSFFVENKLYLFLDFHKINAFPVHKL